MVMKMFGQLSDPYLKHKFLAAVYIDNWDYAEKAIVEKRPMHEIRLLRARAIRAFLLYLVGCTIFSNKSNYYVEIVYLQIFSRFVDCPSMELGRCCSCSFGKLFGPCFFGKNDSDGWLHVISSGTNICEFTILRYLYTILLVYNKTFLSLF
jgi:hypothetical protein